MALAAVQGCGGPRRPPSSPPVATHGAGGIVHGEGHAFVVGAPAGWVLDNQSGVPDGLHAVFYREGSSWERGDVVMYANTCLKARDACRTIDEMLAFDEAQFRQRSPGMVVGAAPSLETATPGKRAVVRRFVGDRHGSAEAVAYVDEPTVVVLLVVSAPSVESLDAAYPAFEELVRSYSWIGSETRDR